MGKITKQIMYSGKSLCFIKEVKNLKMYINESNNYCVIADRDDNVLFEISSYAEHYSGYLKDAYSNS